MARLLPKLRKGNPAVWRDLTHESHCDAMARFSKYEQEDFTGAMLDDVARYLRGSKALNIPASWKDLVPKSF